MPKPVFLFPGQGAQQVGMGKALCETLPAARNLFDEAKAVLGYDLAAHRSKPLTDLPDIEWDAVVTVEEACRLFPGSNLLAINVTGQPAFYSTKMTCPLREVMIAPAGAAPEQVFTFGDVYQDLVDRGYKTTWQALPPLQSLASAQQLARREVDRPDPRS